MAYSPRDFKSIGVRYKVARGNSAASLSGDSLSDITGQCIVQCARISRLSGSNTLYAFCIGTLDLGSEKRITSRGDETRASVIRSSLLRVMTSPKASRFLFLSVSAEIITEPDLDGPLGPSIKCSITAALLETWSLTNPG